MELETYEGTVRRKAFLAPLSDFALIKITEWSGDDKEAEIYRISANEFNFLKKYLEEGFVSREIRRDLLHTLSGYQLGLT